ncbi:hypothetical protein [Massilia antarctica]|uniref:hypothetical protein n=1 Tax=Massilia antarctica TaxID=2765360 RepID=UPI0006BE14AC|nr:hypothetical protein [Massilia sp. H27-R4]MCY0911056.1 hypothetical protein [Massilia sp. H27-R4]CUI05367.1 FIG01211730: hypothetical protein [Janthinobacterium sp. CG23_2]CUU29153.1 FIG01211730: hypothetical protein [Janthinobacterium sp. CG23_2]
MNAVTRAISRVDAGVVRLWDGLDRALVLRLSIWFAPVLAGLASMWLGQDANWDLRNYHWYNPYAFLNGKIGLDLNPGQFQSYFNPTIDLLYYGLATHFPTRVTGFVMGFLHGLNFVLLLMITRQVLGAGEAAAADAAPRRLALMLALAGCAGFSFLSQLGNTMGDNLTSLTVLGAIALLLRQWPQLLAGGARGAMVAALAGLIIGAGTGLKLTNANYALALCLALLTLRASLWRRLSTAFVFGLGTLAGIGASAGHWYWLMWKQFGNPLFPQFNNIFKSPLAAPISVADMGWIPKDWTEFLLWPFIFTFNPRRVIELPMTQILWPIVYLAFIAFIAQRLRRLWLAAPAPSAAATAGADTAGARMLLVFFALSYVIWLKLFAIYRYLVPLELLAPLVLWLLLHRLCALPAARVIGASCLLLAVIAGFPRVNWGHHGNAPRSFQVQVPAFADPSQNMVFTVHGDPPMSWLIPNFPARLAFAALGSGFPESPQFAARVATMVAARKGPLYVMLTANGLAPGPRQGGAVPDPDTIARQLRVHEAGQEILKRYGLTFNPASCVVYEAGFGGGRNSDPYQLCEVGKLP